MLWSDGRARAKDADRLPCRRKKAAAPRRDVARGGADPSSGCPRGVTTWPCSPPLGCDRTACLAVNDPTMNTTPAPSQEPPPGLSWNSPSGLWRRKTTVIAAVSIGSILVHLLLRFGFHATAATSQIPL